MSEHSSEYSHEENFRKLIKTSDVDVDINIVVDAANKSFEEVLGLTEGALETWNTVTLPDAIQVYQGTPLKLGNTLLDIIDKAGEQKGVANTLSYLENVIPKDEVAFSKTDRESHSKELVSDIENIILEFSSRYGDVYKGVVAVVIWGSYARFQQRLRSDLDLSIISVDDTLGFPVGELWVNTDDFEEIMTRKLDNDRGYHVEVQAWSDAIITDEQSIRDMIDITTPAFLVASPFPDVKEKVQRLLQEEVQKASGPSK